MNEHGEVWIAWAIGGFLVLADAVIIVYSYRKGKRKGR